MRFLALVVVVAVCNCEAKTVEELVSMANEAGAPFTPSALQRLNNSTLWGAQRANVSNDIVIINSSGCLFELVNPECDIGNFSTGLEPEKNILAHSSTVWGIQSSQHEYDLMCGVYYIEPSTHKYTLAIGVDHELNRDIDVRAGSDIRFEIRPDYEQGNNTQVRIMVIGRGDCSTRMPNLTAGAPRSQVKLKGSRNKFVKASKRGSRVRSI